MYYDMKKVILLALAVIAFAACSKQPQVMENQAIQNIMTRVSVREFTGEKISDAVTGSDGGPFCYQQTAVGVYRGR